MNTRAVVIVLFGGVASLAGSATALARVVASVEPDAPASARVGMDPTGIATDTRSHTVYVVNDATNSVSVLDSRSCRAGRLSGCTRRTSTITLARRGSPGEANSAALSADGRTLYVTMFDPANRVDVLDVSRCNATERAGCRHALVANVPTAKGPVGIAVDPPSGTAYIAGAIGNAVSVLDTRACNGRHPAGCPAQATSIAVGRAPVAVAVNSATRTAYVGNLDDDTVSVIDIARCSATHSAGCRHKPPAQAVGGAPGALAVSTRSDTVYVDDTGNNFEGQLVAHAGTVSVLDGRRCNGPHPRGCTRVAPTTVDVGGGDVNYPQAVAVDPQTQRVFVANSSDDTLSVIDGARCHAGRTSGCAQSVSTVQAGGGPNNVAVVSSTHTVYVTDWIDNAVAILDEHVCGARGRAGCLPSPAPSVRLTPRMGALDQAVVDPAVHTLYQLDFGPSPTSPARVDLVDTDTCNASACQPVSTVLSFKPGASPDGLALDAGTGTLYISEGDAAQGGKTANRVEAVSASTCNVTLHSCSARGTILLPKREGDGPVAVDASTHTVYVAGKNDVSVIDARRCNGIDLVGCGAQSPPTIRVGLGPNAFAIAPHTLYVATGINGPDKVPGHVSVVDTDHCHAGDTSGCGASRPAAVPVGPGPTSAVLDPAHQTLYVTDNDFGTGIGRLSMIDTASCDGLDTSGCHQRPPSTPTRRAPHAAALDPTTETLYVSDYGNASLSAIDTAHCNAFSPTSCAAATRRIVVGSGPVSLAFDPSHQTVYTTNRYQGTVSLVPAMP